MIKILGNTNENDIKDRDRKMIWVDAWQYFMNTKGTTKEQAIEYADFMLAEYDSRFTK